MNIQRITPIIASVSFAFLLIFTSPMQADAKSDSAITAEVRQALGNLEESIRVKTKDGRVYLRGNVAYMDQANSAEWAARRVEGVHSVIADIGYVHSNSGN